MSDPAASYLGKTTVFETKDVPIPEYKQTGGHDSNVVEEIQLNLAAAKKLYGKDKLDTKNVDFSDNVMKEKEGGYGLGQVQYELLSCTTNETPLQKYQRLKLEVSEFAEDLEKMNKSAEEKDAASVKLAAEVRNLSDNLAEMKVEMKMGALKLKEPGHAAITRQLESQISAFKEKSAKDPGAAGAVTYEVHYRGDHAKFAEASRVAAIEKRITELEGKLGKDLKLLTTVTSDCPDKSVLSVVAALQTKLSLIEPNDYAHIETRLQAVLHKMDLLKAKAKEIPETNNKVTEVYDLVRKIEPALSAMPEIVNRLTTLKAIHEHAAQFATNLSALESTQGTVTKNLASQAALLKKVEDNISENLKQITDNCSNVSSRIEKLGKKK